MPDASSALQRAQKKTVVAAIIAVAGSFTLWAAVHTLLASRWLKRRARRVIGEAGCRWYRIVYVGFSVMSLLPVLALVPLLPDRTLYSVPSPWRYAMMGVELAALVALIVSLFQAGVLHFVGLSQLLGDDLPAPGRLQVRGFYRLGSSPQLRLWCRGYLVAAGDDGESVGPLCGDDPLSRHRLLPRGGAPG